MSTHKSSAEYKIIFEQYWQLIRALLFNLKTFGYVVAIFLGLGLFSILLMLFKNTAVFGAAFASLSFLIVSMVVFMAMPIGFVAILSNKQLAFMANLRGKLFLMGAICCFMLIAVASILMFFAKRQVLTINHILIVTLFYALYFWVTAYVATKVTSVAMLVPAAAIFIASFIFSSLAVMATSYLALFNVIAWFLLFRWWMRFSPFGGVKIMKSLQILNAQGQTLPMVIPMPGERRVRTPMGTLLLGFGDSYLARIVRIAAAYVFTFLLSFYLFGFFSEESLSVRDLTAGFFAAIAYVIVIVGVDLFGVKTINRIKRNWLLFPCDRMGIFQYLEKSFLMNWSYLILFNIFLVISFLIITHNTDYLFFGINLVLVMALLVIGNFYGNIYFYGLEGKSRDFNPYKLCINILILLATIHYLIKAFDRPNLLGWITLALPLLILGSIPVIGVIRSSSMKKWQTASF